MRAWYGGITVCWWWYASLSLLICGERSASQFIQDGMVPYYHTTIPYREAAFHTLTCLCLKSQKQPWRPTIIIWYVCTVAPQIIFVFLNQVCLLPFTTPHDLEPKSFFSAKERLHTDPKPIAGSLHLVRWRPPAKLAKNLLSTLVARPCGFVQD